MYNFIGSMACLSDIKAAYTAFFKLSDEDKAFLKKNETTKIIMDEARETFDKTSGAILDSEKLSEILNNF